MTLLIPLGLLALLSLVVLLIIYLIKPNYQQRFVSSTYVWILSRKYRRKKIPINRIRNILIIICQILILVACAFIIARPAVSIKEDISESELIIVIDSSASMRTDNGDGSRLERAVEIARKDAQSVIDGGGYVSLVQAAGDSELLAFRESGSGGMSNLNTAFADMIDDGCTYGTSDINAAITLCEEEILIVNPDAQIRIYTDLEYSYVPTDSGVEVVNVADTDKEWNAAILDAYTEKIDGYYIVYADIATYGRAAALDIEVTIKGATYRDPGQDEIVEVVDDVSISASVQCNGEDTVTLMIVNEGTYGGVFAGVLDDGPDGRYQVFSSSDYIYYYYDEIEIRILDEDSYDLDNVYYVYGGRPDEIKLLYVSTAANRFTNLALTSVQSAYEKSNKYTITITSITNMTDETLNDSTNYLQYITGYDFYVFEHIAPNILPTDGVVFLFDPDRAPENSGLTMSSQGHEDTNANAECYLSATEYASSCALMNNIDASKIFITKSSIITADSDYIPLMTFESDYGTTPALLFKDRGESKVVVMTFSVNWSNIAYLSEFPTFFSNMISYFYPATLTATDLSVVTDFTVGDLAMVDSSGPELQVWFAELLGQGIESVVFDIEEIDGVYIYTDDEGEETEYSLPLSYEFTEPGRYRFRVVSYFSTAETWYRDVCVFVHADMSESNIFATGVALTAPYREKLESDYYNDLLLYFAIALVAIIFIEWALHMVEGL